jgi:hypothetical protein
MVLVHYRVGHCGKKSSQKQKGKERKGKEEKKEMAKSSKRFALLTQPACRE